MTLKTTRSDKLWKMLCQSDKALRIPEDVVPGLSATGQGHEPGSSSTATQPRRGGPQHTPSGVTLLICGASDTPRNRRINHNNL